MARCHVQHFTREVRRVNLAFAAWPITTPLRVHQHPCSDSTIDERRNSIEALLTASRRRFVLIDELDRTTHTESKLVGLEGATRQDNAFHIRHSLVDLALSPA